MKLGGGIDKGVKDPPEEWRVHERGVEKKYVYSFDEIEEGGRCVKARKGILGLGENRKVEERKGGIGEGKNGTSYRFHELKDVEGLS